METGLMWVRRDAAENLDESKINRSNCRTTVYQFHSHLFTIEQEETKYTTLACF
jgi:hypothetical protein